MIGAGVMLIVVNLLACVVLLMVHLRAFLAGQVSAVGGAIVVYFVMDVGFFIFQVAGLARSQLPRLHAVADACLLVAFAGVDAAHCCGRGPAVIFRREVRAVGARRMLV